MGPVFLLDVVVLSNKKDVFVPACVVSVALTKHFGSVGRNVALCVVSRTPNGMPVHAINTHTHTHTHTNKQI